MAEINEEGLKCTIEMMSVRRPDLSEEEICNFVQFFLDTNETPFDETEQEVWEIYLANTEVQ